MPGSFRQRWVAGSAVNESPLRKRRSSYVPGDHRRALDDLPRTQQVDETELLFQSLNVTVFIRKSVGKGCRPSFEHVLSRRVCAILTDDLRTAGSHERVHVSPHLFGFRAQFRKAGG